MVRKEDCRGLGCAILRRGTEEGASKSALRKFLLESGVSVGRPVLLADRWDESVGAPVAKRDEMSRSHAANVDVFVADVR